MEGQLNSARNTQFLKNAIKVIAHRVFADTEDVRDFAVLHPFANQLGNFVLAWSEQSNSAGFGQAPTIPSSLRTA